jgi:hypothetical protein
MASVATAPHFGSLVPALCATKILARRGVVTALLVPYLRFYMRNRALHTVVYP